MKHIDREEAAIADLLRRTRTIAVVGASPKPGRHSRDVVRYLHDAGYDVIPVRPDRATVEGLPTYASLEDIAGPVDLVVIFRRAGAALDHFREAAQKRAEAVWLPPGAWTRAAEDEARRHNLVIVKERCIIEEHSHLAGALGEAGSGHPHKTSVHERRRHRMTTDERVLPDPGYEEGGGGGRRAGGGIHAVLDEKKMTKRKR